MDEFKDSGIAIVRERLRDAGTKITEDNDKIQADLQAVRDLSVEYDREYQMYIYLDRKTGLLSSIMGPTGNNYHAQVKVTNSCDSCANYIYGDPPPAMRILIGEAHGHPATSTEVFVIANEDMSQDDMGMADTFQIAVYGVDALNGGTGKSAEIHRVKPDSSITYCGMTWGKKHRGKPFDIGADALEVWARSRIPIFSPEALRKHALLHGALLQN